jgi:glucokinase
MFLAIEIGGTKLQLAVGSGDGRPLAALKRIDVDPRNGAEGIRRQIEQSVRPLVEQHAVRGIGIGFGGPVDSAAGRTITSHQVDGWDDFPLVDWCRQMFHLPVALANDSDMAGLAEARFGAGRRHRIVFYTNVGSGIGGALVIDGDVYPGSGGIASEIGHLRPGLACTGPHDTLESLASGWGITAAVQRAIEEPAATARSAQDVEDLLARCCGSPQRLDTKTIADAAADGNGLARDALDRACRAYGWGVAQVITLLAPSIVVVGGGVALIGESFWFRPLREYVGQYVFPPLAGTFELVPAKLTEEVVLHGALALAASRKDA